METIQLFNINRSFKVAICKYRFPRIAYAAKNICSLINKRCTVFKLLFVPFIYFKVCILFTNREYEKSLL